MSIENPRTPSVDEKKKEAFDEQWYARFESLGSFQDYEYLEGKKEEREKQKKYFLDEAIRNPNLGYPKLEKFDFKGKESGLLELKKEILEKEGNDIVRQVYRWKINEKLAQLRMLKETKIGNDRRFSRYATFLYGGPEQNIFNESIRDVAVAIEKSKESDDIRVLLAGKRLEESMSLGSISDGNKEEGENLLPNKKRILMYPFKKERELSSVEIADAFQEALQNLEAEGWRVVIDENITNIAVSQEKKHVKVPENRKMSETELEGLIAHEIGTHVARRESGERSSLKILGLGLDRYLKGEEGISTYSEQKIKGADDFAGFDGHLVISLARGLDGKKRDFRDVFGVMRDYFFIKNHKTEDKQKAWEGAKNKAWNICVRTFRGTTCASEGACLTRDIVYREGNIGIWDLIKKKSGEVKRFSVGKYDPTNPRHIWILEQLGITDEDLETLEK